MRNVVDTNRCPEHAQGDPLAQDVLKPNGEQTIMSDSSLDDLRQEPVLRSTGRCPMHAMLEGLDIWQGLDPDFRPDPPDHA